MSSGSNSRGQGSAASPAWFNGAKPQLSQTYDHSDWTNRGASPGIQTKDGTFDEEQQNEKTKTGQRPSQHNQGTSNEPIEFIFDCKEVPSEKSEGGDGNGEDQKEKTKAGQISIAISNRDDIKLILDSTHRDKQLGSEGNVTWLEFLSSLALLEANAKIKHDQHPKCASLPYWQTVALAYRHISFPVGGALCN
jgi:hypothetical protein